MIALLSSLLLGGTLNAALAAPPAAPALPEVSGEMIIWSGGKTADEARGQLSALEPVIEALTQVMTGLEPFVAESSKVEGLKAGFHVVALGVCPKKDETEFALKVFQTLHPDVYTRTVKFKPLKGSEPSCPEAEVVDQSDNPNPERWKLEHAMRVSSGGNTLVGLAFKYSWAEMGDFASEYFDVYNLFLLFDPKRRILDQVSFSGPTTTTTNTSFKPGGNGFAFSVEYADPRCSPDPDRFVSWSMDASLTVAAGKLKLDTSKPRELKSGSCGFAEEAKMISGEDRAE